MNIKDIAGPAIVRRGRARWASAIAVAAGWVAAGGLAVLPAWSQSARPVLTADLTSYFYRYWFDGFPWDNVEAYWQRSPLAYVGNVQTPTMLMTGEVDYRTPSSEAEQFYEALKLRKIDTALVRVPNASHDISARPSLLIDKVAYVLAWFRAHDTAPQ